MPLWISDDLEIWPERDSPVRFTQIAALHSEFIAVSTKGELHQWRWSDSEPYKNHENPSIFHPKTQSLNLIYEKVCQISATSIRCTIATESNRVATWMDELLGHSGNKLEHAAISFPEFAHEKIHSLYTCTLYTVVRTDSNSLYWWGVLPYEQRKRLWEKHNRSKVSDSFVIEFFFHFRFNSYFFHRKKKIGKVKEAHTIEYEFIGIDGWQSGVHEKQSNVSAWCNRIHHFKWCAKSWSAFKFSLGFK